MKVDIAAVFVLIAVITFMSLALLFALTEGPRRCFCRGLQWVLQKARHFQRFQADIKIGIAAWLKERTWLKTQSPAVAAAGVSSAEHAATEPGGRVGSCDGPPGQVTGVVTVVPASEEHEMS